MLKLVLGNSRPDWTACQLTHKCLPDGLQLLCGIISGAVAGTATAPFDTLRTRVVAKKGGESAAQVLDTVVHNEGGVETLIKASLTVATIKCALDRGLQVACLLAYLCLVGLFAYRFVTLSRLVVRNFKSCNASSLAPATATSFLHSFPYCFLRPSIPSLAIV